MVPDAKAYWNDVAGPRWVADHARLTTMLAPFSERVLKAAAVRRGHRVVDVGCGCGAIALEAARVGAETTGIDLSRPMLDFARQRAAALGLAVDFREGDAQAQDFAGVDRVLSRFGVMFFQDPDAAFANFRRWLAPAGSLHVAVWQPLDRNPWLGEALSLVSPWLPDELLAGSDDAGPFSLGDTDRLVPLLREAGFPTIELEDVRRPLTVTGTPEEVVAFFLERGAIDAALKAYPEARADIVSGLELLVERNHDGVAWRQDAAVWVVSARV